MEHPDTFNCFYLIKEFVGMDKIITWVSPEPPFRTILPKTIQPGYHRARCQTVFPSSAAGAAAVAKKRSDKSHGVIQAEIVFKKLCIHL